MYLGFNADEIFSVAIEIEENGRVFYGKARELTDNKEVRNLFSYLEQAEINHKEKFTELRSRLPDKATSEAVWDPDNEDDEYLKILADTNVFRKDTDVKDKLSRISDFTDSLKLAIQFEKDSILFYSFIKDFTDKSKGREFIDKIIDEEKKHLRELSRELNRHH